MIAALVWGVSKLRAYRAARKREPSISRAVLAMKRERYDLNPAMRVRTRIPKVGRP